MKKVITFFRRLIGTPFFLVGITLAFIGGRIYGQTTLSGIRDYLEGVSDKLKTKKDELDS
jgi:hypothetical protein